MQWVNQVKYQEDLSYFRYTVDRIEDLKLVKEIVKNISVRPVLIQDVIKLYKKRPEIFEINKNVKHDGHISSLKKDKQYLNNVYFKYILKNNVVAISIRQNRYNERNFTFSLR